MPKNKGMYFPIDPYIRAEAESLCAKYGLTLPKALETIIRIAVQNGSLPLEHSAQNAVSETDDIEASLNRFVGVLNKYADPTKIPLEETAWEEAAAKRYGHT
ncbi:MAG: hypothetical protein LBR73_03105 [Oscillospiraceae bacterium]|jgi:antitoxin component of RelBE/YafQ-DinJ toxin-antitoxin module|nr:hypothetical protein [Oscillospiraceae bacterium]